MKRQALTTSYQQKNGWSHPDYLGTLESLLAAFIEYDKYGIGYDIVWDILLVAEVSVLRCLLPNSCPPLAALLGGSRVRNMGGLDAVQALLSNR